MLIWLLDQIRLLVSAPPLNIKPIIANGKPVIRYKWKTPDNFNFVDTLNSFEISPTTDTSLRLIVTDGNGCVDSTQISIFIKQLPVVDLGPR